MHDLDLLIYAIFAFAIFVRLFVQLGRRPIYRESDFRDSTGHQAAQDLTHMPAHNLLKALDKHFKIASFTKDAESIYRQVIQHYATGDTQRLSRLVDIQVLQKLAHLINERERSGKQCHISLISVSNCQILSAQVTRGTGVNVSVTFECEAVFYMMKGSELVAGDKFKVEQWKEKCTLARDSSTSAWKVHEIEHLFVG